MARRLIKMDKETEKQHDNSPERFLNQLLEEPIDSTEMGKTYLSKRYQALRKISGRSIPMSYFSKRLNKAPTYFASLLRNRSATDSGTKLTPTVCLTLHKLTNGAFDIDRMLPDFKELLRSASYFRLTKESLTDDTKKAIEALGYIERPKDADE